MVRKCGVSLLAFVAFLALSSCAPTPQVEPADMVVTNAKIVTIDQDNPRAEAIAITGEVIVAIGSNDDISPYIEEGRTQVIDAGGRLVTPGFNDAHAHYGPLNPDYIDLRYITDPTIMTERVREAVAKAQPGEMIRGGNWEHEMFTTREWPTKELIDSVSPNNPVSLSRADGHSRLVNSYVLKNSGITKDTPDPPGGEIQKDPVTGEPTGIFKESAGRLLDYGAVKVDRTPEEQEQRYGGEAGRHIDSASRRRQCREVSKVYGYGKADCAHRCGGTFDGGP